MPANGPPERPPLILAVDDSVTTRVLLRKLLEDSYRVAEAADGIAALESMAAEPPDAVILDLEMPRMDGFEFLERVRADPALRETPVIILSIFSEVENRVHGLETGALDFVPKPFDSRELRLRVDRAVDRHLQRRALEVKLGAAARIVKEKESLLAMSRDELVESHRELQEHVRRLDELNRERDRAEQELSRRNLELSNALAVKTDFIAMVSHELRTPLTPIIGYSGLLRSGKFGPLSDRADHALDVISRRAGALRKLIENLLILSQTERGALGVMPEPIPVLTRLQEIAADFMRTADATDAEVQVRGESVAVWADPDRFRDIIVNLLDNAVKYSDSAPKVLIEAGVDRDMGFIAVTDAGIGIAAEQQPRVFDRFHQVEKISTRRRGGAGLGLSIAAELAGLMGGEIGLKSEPGFGSTFTVRLPLAGTVAAAPARARETDSGPEPGTDAGGPRVLCVDDDPFLTEMIEAALESEWRVMTVESAERARDLLESEAVDAIVLDIMMPGMDGLEFLRRLKADPRTRGIPVILLTARADADAREQALRDGAFAFIPKPFDPAELAAQLEKTRPG